jgi:hypothetical protein
VKTALAEHARELKETSPDLFGLAVLTGDGIRVSRPVVASITAHELEGAEPYYQYCVDEWKNYDAGHILFDANEPLEALNEKFEEFLEALEDDESYEDGRFEWTAAHVAAIDNALIRAMRELKNEGAFDFAPSEVFMVVWVSPTGSSSSICGRSVRQLNPPSVYEVFSQCIEP